MKSYRQTIISSSMIALSFMAFTPASAATASSDSRAEIAESSVVQKLSDLQFGDIVTGSSPSTVAVNASTDARQVTSGDAIALGGTVSAASFRVEARPLLFYRIIVPASTTITRVGGSETMLVDNFTLNGPSLRLLPLFTPVGTFKVGGRLNVAADQEAGTYEGSFNVTVNFL